MISQPCLSRKKIKQFIGDHVILVDLTQVVISNIMQNLGFNPKEKLDEDLIRHMVLNSIRSYNRQFKANYGSMVICCDSKHYWRRSYFPFYKHHRKKDREKSDYDWNLIFETLAKLKLELKENFPYRVVEVEGAEADDIIAVLAKRYASNEKVLILSSDKDFVQLQKHPNITQYSPILKRYVQVEDPTLYIKEHILKGDRGDGIPNFLSSDNVFVLGERQKTITKAKLEQWIHQKPEDFCINDNMLRGYKRNQTLVDLDFVPEELQMTIVSEFETQKINPKQKLFNYFIEKRLKKMLETIDEF